jgi:hypothetical protein
MHVSTTFTSEQLTPLVTGKVQGKSALTTINGTEPDA